MTYKWIIFLNLFLLFACAQQQRVVQQSRPAWIENPALAYNSSNYLTAVGNGLTLQDAENNALGNLAKIFSVQVKVNETLVSHYLEEAGSVSSSALLMGKTDTKTVEKLKNIKIGHTYFSAAEGLYYALAVLDRQETARIYRQEIESNNAKMSHYFTSYQKAKNPFKRLKNVARAKELALLNETLIARYRIIDASNDVHSALQPEQLSDAEQKERANISIVVLPAAQANSELEEEINEIIGKIGLKISAQPAELVLSYEMTNSPVPVNRKNLSALQWRIVITLKDVSGQKSKQTLNFGKRTVAINLEQAKIRMMRHIQKWIQSELATKLEDFLIK